MHREINVSGNEADVVQVSTTRRLWEVAVRNQAIVVPVMALSIAFAVGAILISFQGVNPLYAYESLFRSALFSTAGLERTFEKATPLILTGLAVAVAFRVGLFNIGAQGQLLTGALASAWAGFTFTSLPGFLLVPVAIVFGALGGAMWGSIAGLLKAYRGVHEVISTIMLNTIALGIIEYLISYPLQEPGQVLSRTPAIADQAKLPVFGFIPSGFFLALASASVIAWLLTRTTLGFKFTTVGKNKFAAAYAGIKLKNTIVLSMVFSGALAGIGGAIETLGVIHRYESGFNDGIGFDGITIALLARGNPWGTIPAALLVAVLRSGAATLQFDTGIEPEVVDLLLAITLLLVSLPLLGKAIFKDRAIKNDNVTSGWGS
jgi:simple sugar transport system permease protein